jgi:hypothetical protein
MLETEECLEFRDEKKNKIVLRKLVRKQSLIGSRHGDLQDMRTILKWGLEK